jgi:hypothetical protein
VLSEYLKFLYAKLRMRLDHLAAEDTPDRLSDLRRP